MRGPASSSLGPTEGVVVMPRRPDRHPSAEGRADGTSIRLARSAVRWVTRLLAVSWVLVLHGFVPGSSQIPLTSLMGAGYIQCLHDQGVTSLTTWCMSIGLPVGAPRLTGAAEVYAGWLISYVPGVDAWAAHQISSAVFVAAAFGASLALLHRWGVPWLVGVAASTAYLTAPNLLALNGFGYTFMGFILVPAYVWLALRVLDDWEAEHHLRAALVCASLSIVMVFTDGYSFLGAGVVVGCLVVARVGGLIRQGRWGRAVLGTGLWVACVGGASAMYVLWVPDGGFESGSALETFALHGTDLVTLVLPGSAFMIARWAGLSPLSQGLWGEGGALDTSFLGYVVLVLAAIGAWTLRASLRSRGRHSNDLRGLPGEASHLADAQAVGSDDGLDAFSGRSPRTGVVTAELRAVAIAGVITLVLSLGPTLKVGQSVPGLDASMWLPTAWLYDSVPGFTELRAVHRWLVVSRWAVIVLAAVGFTVMWRSPRRVGLLRTTAVVVVGALAVVEVMPDVPRELDLRALSISRVTYLHDGLEREASLLIRDGETILILPQGNDFLANFLVPVIGARSYNVGIDKNYVISTSEWPPEIAQAGAIRSSSGADSVCTALTLVDAVVLTYISPSTGPLLHSNSRVEEAKREATARWLARDPRFDAQVGEWLTVLRAAPGSCGS